MSANQPQHPQFSRRTLLQAGTVGLLGLGSGDLAALHADQPPARTPAARRIIYIFLSGGLAQHDSFDLKPNAPDTIRGEFRPTATRTPGVHICEHLPLLCSAATCGRRAGR